jgi:hypothetical protein
MKKCIYIGLLLLLPVSLGWGQSPPPADTGAAAADTSKTQTGADTAAVSPTPADTGFAPPVPANPSPADTETSPPPEAVPSPAVTKPAEEEEAPAPGKPKRLGLGIVFNDAAPLGARLWFNPKVGLDFAIGLRGRRVLDATDSIQPPSRKVTLLDLSFDLGLPVKALLRDRVNFIVRPGFGLRIRPDFAQAPNNPNIRSIESGFELEFNGTAGFEYFPVEKASFSLSAGFALVAQRPGGQNSAIFRLESLPSGRGVNFAFRYYIL